MACVQLPWPRPPARQLAPQFRPHSTEPSYNPGTTSHQTAAGELEEARTNAAASRGHSGHLDSHLKPARNRQRLTHPSALFYPTCEQLWPSLQYSPEKHCYHCSNNLIKKKKCMFPSVGMTWVMVMESSDVKGLWTSSAQLQPHWRHWGQLGTKHLGHVIAMGVPLVDDTERETTFDLSGKERSTLWCHEKPNWISS